jgi:hypothetical protein
MSLSALAGIALLGAGALWARVTPDPSQTQLAVAVLEGDGAINSIRHRRAREPLVRVTDDGGEPVRGAAVTFVLPAYGPSGSFEESGLSVTLQTDERGLARGRGLKPNQIAGRFQIRVTASLRGVVGSAIVTQTNVEPTASSGNSRKIALISVIAAGVAGGVLGITRLGRTEPAAVTTPPPSGGSIAAGTPSFGPPR